MTAFFSSPAAAGMPSPIVDSALATSVEVEPAQGMGLSGLSRTQVGP